MIKRLEKIIFCSLLFLFPTQIGYHFWPNFAFVFGIRVDFLAPTIYLTDIFVFILLVLNLKIFKKYIKLFLLLALISLVNICFSSMVLESVYKWIKIFELSFLSIYIMNQKVVSTLEILKTLFYSAAAFSLIGILQFINGGTVGGLLYFLGERNFSINTPGIALVSLLGKSFMRAYSTFSHPNSLAGYLGVIIILFLNAKIYKKNIIDTVSFFLIFLAFCLTFSLGAFIALALVFVFRRRGGLVLILSVIASLILPIVSNILLNFHFIFNQKVGDRLQLAGFAGEIISQKFFAGSGLGTFINNIPYRFLQPVHNIFLLVFSETGIFGFFGFVYLLFKIVKNNSLAILFVIFTGLFDHYQITLQQNMLMVSLLVGLSFTKSYTSGKIS